MNLTRNFAFTVTATIILFAALLALGACSGSSKSSDVQPSQQGAVKVFLTDAATDSFNQILVTITGVTLIGADGSEHVISSNTTTVDLMNLTDFSQFLAQSNIAAGSYEKIRLDVSGIVLNQVDENGNIVNSQTVTVPSGKIDLNPRQTIDVADGGELTVEMDFDAHDSFKLAQTGSGKVIFRPVVFVHVVGDGETQPGRLVREHGTITNLNIDAGTLSLCGVGDDDGGECLDVVLDDQTTLFDPGLAAIIPNDLVENAEATVFGHVVKDDNGTHIQALVLVTGPASTLVDAHGDVVTAPDSNGLMSINVGSGEDVPAGETSVQLASNVQVVSRSTGDPLQTSDLTVGTSVMVIGQFDSGTSTFTAIAVSVDDHTDAVQGTVTAINPDAGSTDAMTLTLDTSGGGTACVHINAATHIAMHHDGDDDVVDSGMPNDISVGSTLAAQGQTVDNCLDADRVVTGG